MHRPVRVAVKDDRSHRRLDGERRLAAGALAHGVEGRSDIARRPIRQPRVNSGRGEKIGVGRRQNRRHGAAGGEARDEDPVLIDGELRRDLAHDSGEDSRLSQIARLIL